MKRTVPTMAVCVVLSAAFAAQARDADPMLRIVSMTGEMEVHHSKWGSSMAGKGAALPLIAPGSRVRVLSGDASFETNTHAKIHAKAGDIFSVWPHLRGEARGLWITALGDQTTLRVDAGKTKLLLHPGGSVALHASASGRDNIEVVTPRVDLAQGSVLEKGESLTISLYPQEGLSPGDGLYVRAPETLAFSEPALDLSRVKSRAQTTALGRTLTLRLIPEALAAVPAKPAASQASSGGGVRSVVASLPEEEKEELRSAVSAVSPPVKAPQPAPGVLAFPEPPQAVEESPFAEDVQAPWRRFLSKWWMELSGLCLVAAMLLYASFRSRGNEED